MASCQGSWCACSCSRSATAIHSVSVNWTPNLPVERQSLYHWASPAPAISSPPMSSCHVMLWCAVGAGAEPDIFIWGGHWKGPVLQQGELSMVCVGLQCSGMTSRGKFWGATGEARKNIWGAVAPPGTPLAPPLCWGIFEEPTIGEKGLS